MFDVTNTILQITEWSQRFADLGANKTMPSKLCRSPMIVTTKAFKYLHGCRYKTHKNVINTDFKLTTE